MLIAIHTVPTGLVGVPPAGPAMPEIEKHVDMMHIQELVPEKACWSMNSGFGDVMTPISNLLCVGSDAEKRSMGLTRSSYSVIRMMKSLGYISSY